MDGHLEHPRGCGADITTGMNERGLWGASPRVRGRPHSPTPRTRPDPEHPRGCGADVRSAAAQSRRGGASPRVRGRRRRPRRAGRRPRSIPAGAGPTTGRAPTRGQDPEHPRGCGADLVRLERVTTERGASPRVRGRLQKPGGTGPAERSIPAGAGPTPCPDSARPWAGEHPRGCGADSGRRDSFWHTHGASPRARGRLLDPRQRHDQHRSIPAGAGPTRRSGRGSRRPPEHPRGCGADRKAVEVLRKEGGASPRVRGRPYGGVPDALQPGSIPAGAGPTTSRPEGGSAPKEHPRGCGADLGGMGPSRRRQGASPRVRGRRR